MILTKLHYAVACDKCGEVFEEEGPNYWDSLQGVLDLSAEWDWKHIKQDHGDPKSYCPDCSNRCKNCGEQIDIREPPNRSFCSPECRHEYL